MGLRLREVRQEERKAARELASRCGSTWTGRVRHELSVLGWSHEQELGLCEAPNPDDRPSAGALTHDAGNGVMVVEVLTTPEVNDEDVGRLIDKCLLKVQAHGVRRLRVHVLDADVERRLWRQRTVPCDAS